MRVGFSFFGVGERNEGKKKTIGNKPTTFRWHTSSNKEKNMTKNKMRQRKHIFNH
jgi:hypothetical protein